MIIIMILLAAATLYDRKILAGICLSTKFIRECKRSLES